MDPVAPDALALASLLKSELSNPDNFGYWRRLELLKLPGVDFVGHWGTHDLNIGDRVVVLRHSEMTSNPVLVIGRIEEDPRSKNFCVIVKPEAIVTPKDESPESAGINLNKPLLAAGFELFGLPARPTIER